MLLRLSSETIASTLSATTAAELDELGRLSGVAQGLSGPITSCDKLGAQGVQQHLLLYFDEERRALGYLKWGVKDNLYFYRKSGAVVQCSPVCVLDFYVHESLQRHGIGLDLFKAMLVDLGESVKPHLLAYDRPSPKLLSFMRKNFGLTQPDLQPNRYCIFENFLPDL